MKKIMFDDRFGLTQGVINETKLLTRRLLINQNGNLAGHVLFTKKGSNVLYVRADFDNGNSEDCKFAIGEIVAVAQSYKDSGVDFVPNDPTKPRQWGYTKRMRGFDNKMFVNADMMPYKIVISDIYPERLRKITDEDCLLEGIRYIDDIGKYYFEDLQMDEGHYFDTAREAFASLIDKVYGFGMWHSNPYVWRIALKLIK